MGERVPVHDQLRKLFDDNDEDRSPSLQEGRIIQYDTGAKREVDDDKVDPEGFLSPIVIEAYCRYMHFNRKMPDGSLRDGDDWQQGIPFNRLMRSMWRHFKDCWLEHRLWPTKQGRVFNLCALLFNTQAYLHQVLTQDPHAFEKAMLEAEKRREKEWGVTKESIGFLGGKEDG